jgi:hypothetical protein
MAVMVKRVAMLPGPVLTSWVGWEEVVIGVGAVAGATGAVVTALDGVVTGVGVGVVEGVAGAVTVTVAWQVAGAIDWEPLVPVKARVAVIV